MKIIAKFLLCGLLILPAAAILGQTGKFGHINSQELLSAMPESDSAQAKMQKLQTTYETQFEEMQVELNKKYDDYLTNRESYTDLIRQTKEAEITAESAPIGEAPRQAQRHELEVHHTEYAPQCDAFGH